MVSSGVELGWWVIIFILLAADFMFSFRKEPAELYELFATIKLLIWLGLVGFGGLLLALVNPYLTIILGWSILSMLMFNREMFEEELGEFKCKENTILEEKTMERLKQIRLTIREKNPFRSQLKWLNW